MENKPKKSKALIITIIALILLLIVGYLIFKNRDSFGVKTSASIAKIFSPLISSTNSKNLATVQVEAGEDIKKGDNVSVFGTGTNNVPIVMKTTGSNSVFGSAYEDINSGNTGQINPNTKSNSFFNSFANFLGGVLGGNKENTTPPAGGISTTPPAGGWAMDSNTGNWNFDPNGTGGWVFDSTLDKWTPPSDLCSNGAINPPLCTINPEGSCIKGEINPPLCTIGPDGKCSNGATNPPGCTNLGGDPDLIAGIVAPTSTTINTPTKISATITNIGGSSTVTSFSSFFTINRTLGTATPVEIATTIPVLESKTGSISEITYTFDTAGEYQIRACADKKSSSDAGIITESNVDNNCGPWTTFTVTNSLPTGGDLAPGDTTPPGGGIVPPVSSLTPYVNECLLIDKNPLTFTDDEQSQLDELLRKFYLIAPNLKTEDDINIAYSTITQYQNFSDQLNTLINQCYLGTNDQTGYTEFCRLNPKSCSTIDKFNTTYTGPTTKFGNPWYKYNTLRESYIGKTFDCKYVSGWFSGTGADGKDCDTYNRNINKTGIYDISQASCTGSLNLIQLSTWSNLQNHSELYNATNLANRGNLKAQQDLVYTTALNNKCVWNPGANISDMEKISNVW